MTADHAYNIRAFIEHAARFEMEATAIESEIKAALPNASHELLHAPVKKRSEVERLRYLSHDAIHHAETLRKLDGEETSLRTTGTLVSEEIRRQEYLAIINVKCT